MRLSFPNGEHTDVVADNATVSIGSAATNQIVLDDGGVSPTHARLVMDRRGCILEVLDSAARTHLNARPVRERALLRAGDTVCFGTIPVMLKQNTDAAIRTSLNNATSPPRDLNAPPARIVLRGLNGPWSGKSVVIERLLIVGSGAGSDLVLEDDGLAAQHAAIENHGDAVFLRHLGENSGTAINGIFLKDAVLHSGDQIVFDKQRFVLEAPGLPVRGGEEAAQLPGARPITQIMQAVQLPKAERRPEPPAAASHAIWWLIGAGAVIGLAIVALLLWGNQ